MLIPERSGWFVTPAGLDQETINRYCLAVKGVPGVEVLCSSANNAPVQGVRVPQNALFLLADSPPRQEKSEPRLGAPFSLRPYQLDAVQYIHQRNYGILAHDLGTGKTSTAIAAGESPMIVMCPVSAIEVWKLELDLWGISYQVLRGKVIRRDLIDEAVEAYIIPFSSTKWCSQFNRVWTARKIHTIIVDEAHYLQKKSLRWTRDIKLMAYERIILLTATPIRNRLASLYSLLDVATPGAWGYQGQFRVRYCGAIEGEYGLVDGEPTNTDELRKRLEDVVHVQNWGDPSMKGLRPPLERKVTDLDLPVEDRSRIINEGIGYVADRGHTQGSTLVLDGKLREALGKTKARRVAKQFGEYLDRHSRIVVWFWYKKNLDAFRSAIPKTVDIDIVTGSTTQKVRERIIDEWRFGDPHAPRVLLATLPAFSAAVSLTTADAEIFLEFSDAPLDVQQAEKRVHRPGSRHPKITAYYMRAGGTKEDRVVDNILSKIEEIEDLFGEDPQTIQIREIAEETEGRDAKRKNDV